MLGRYGAVVATHPRVSGNLELYRTLFSASPNGVFETNVVLDFLRKLIRSEGEG